MQSTEDTYGAAMYLSVPLFGGIVSNYIVVISK